jgi:hypothetical protein
MLEVAHALHQPLAVIESMTPIELHMHVAFLSVKADEQRAAMDEAKRGGGGKPGMQKMVGFSRPKARK